MSTDALIIESPNPADACVIWLHGLGAVRYDFVPVVKALGLPQRVMNLQQLDESVAMVRGLVEQQLAEGIQAERIVLAGFSQGGAIVMRAAVDSQLPLAGVMALSTYGPSLEEALQQHQGPRLDVFFAHGEHDDILHPQLGRQAHDLLAAAGHTTRWHAYPMAHEVCPQEISDIRQWLTGRLGLR